VLRIEEKEDGNVLYKLTGDHKRNYYLRHELLKVDIEGLIPVEGKQGKVDLNFGEGGFDVEQHFQSMNKKDAQMSQQELEDINKEADAISVYDIQELADDLKVEVEIDLHDDDLSQEKLDKEHRRLTKLKEELEMIPEEEVQNVNEEKKERDNRPIAERVGRVRKQVDHGAVVSAIANNKQKNKNKVQANAQVPAMDVIVAGLQLQAQQVVNPIANAYVADLILAAPLVDPLDALLKNEDPDIADMFAPVAVKKEKAKKEKVKPEKRVQPKRKAKK
jgi:hypothetical protein